MLNKNMENLTSYLVSFESVCLLGWRQDAAGSQCLEVLEVVVGGAAVLFLFQVMLSLNKAIKRWVACMKIKKEHVTTETLPLANA